jgi:hypothetical protein
MTLPWYQNCIVDGVVQRMTLREQQSMFVWLVAKLVQYAYDEGYEFTYGQTLRTQNEAAHNAVSGAGIAHSLHCIGLAVDFNLFVDGKWTTDSTAHKPLGDYWKTLHPLCRWGGDFKKPDGNHYSMEWQGVK